MVHYCHEEVTATAHKFLVMILYSVIYSLTLNTNELAYITTSPLLKEKSCVNLFKL